MRIEFGETQEDERYVIDILEAILRACREARDAGDDAQTARNDLVASLKGCLTRLGFPAQNAPVEELRAVLLATRDAESEISESILNAARRDRETGKLDSAACMRASVHSGRRGVLDNCHYEIGEALKALEHLDAWERRRGDRDRPAKLEEP